MPYQRLPELHRVADVGGGTGVVAMYLAKCHSRAKVVVYDRASRPMQLGRKWAKQLSLGNIVFRNYSFKALAQKSNLLQNDLVLSFRTMDLRLPAPGTGDFGCEIEHCPQFRPKPPKYIQFAVDAVSTLLGVNGLGIFSVPYSAWGLINFLEACRRANLGVDWQLFKDITSSSQGKACITTVWIYLRRETPDPGKGSREDAQAILEINRKMKYLMNSEFATNL